MPYSVITNCRNTITAATTNSLVITNHTDPHLSLSPFRSIYPIYVGYGIFSLENRYSIVDFIEFKTSSLNKQPVTVVELFEWESSTPSIAIGPFFLWTLKVRWIIMMPNSNRIGQQFCLPPFFLLSITRNFKRKSWSHKEKCTKSTQNAKRNLYKKQQQQQYLKCRGHWCSRYHQLQ